VGVHENLEHLGHDVLDASSVDHLRENVAAADLVLPAGAIAELDLIAR
jgi:aryl-alcohol dehydrogenase-like predicted oxidoreductase